MNLYTQFAKEFSETRQSAWEGWEKLIPAIRELGNLRVLDLGCGNGRFLKFLIENNFRIEKYTGVDNSTEMLTMADLFMNSVKANLHISTFELKNLDLDKEDWSKQVEGPYNLIVGFGIMHHIKSFEARKRVLEYSQNLLASKSLLVLTFWQFATHERYKKMRIIPLDLPKDFVLGENDFFLTFGKDKKAYRFCHFTDDKEIEELEAGTDLEKANSFYDDGKDKKQNYYIIYRRKI